MRVVTGIASNTGSWLIFVAPSILYPEQNPRSTFALRAWRQRALETNAVVVAHLTSPLSQVVHAKNVLNLSEESRQEPEIASRHSNQAGNHFREKLFIG